MTSTIHRFISLKSSTAILFAVAALAASPAAAQYRVGQIPRTQVVAEGSSSWRNNCLLIFQGGQWRPQDLCREMRGPRVYDTYRPSTKTWMARIDESDPGWTMSQALNIPNAMWFKYRTNGGKNLYTLVNGQWVDAVAYMAQHRVEATPPPARATLAANCQAFRGPFIAPNVRVELPNEPSCRTPEEKVWHRNMTANIQNGALMNQQRAACMAAQASQPYRSSHRGPDGVMVYILNDGTPSRPGGSLNPGWIWTASGPMQTQCF